MSVWMDCRYKLDAILLGLAVVGSKKSIVAIANVYPFCDDEFLTETFASCGSRRETGILNRRRLETRWVTDRRV